MLKNKNMFEKVGSFSEGYALAKLADGSGYVIINEEGEVSKKTNLNNEEIFFVITSIGNGLYNIYNELGYSIPDKFLNFAIDEEQLDNATFKNGMLTLTEIKAEQKIPTHGEVNGQQKIEFCKRKLNITKSGYVLVGEIEYGTSPSETELPENWVQKKIDRTHSALAETYNNPEHFFKLKSGIHFISVEELRGYLDVAQHSMEQNAKNFSENARIDNAAKFAEKTLKKFAKWLKQYEVFDRKNSGARKKSFGQE